MHKYNLYTVKAKLSSVAYLIVSGLPGSRVLMLFLAGIITCQLLFEFTKCRKLSDINGNIVPSFQSRIVKAFLDIFRVLSWDL